MPDSLLSPQSAKELESSSRFSLKKIALLWVVLALLMLIAMYARLRHLSFDGDFHGWASASCMIMAESFQRLGAIHTHFVPIRNNPPMGLDPDVYLHWPPLFPLLLSLFLRVFGDKESSGRLLALLITLGSTGVVFFLAQHLYGIRTALLSCFFFLTSRVTYECGRLVIHQPLAMLFGSLSVLFFFLAISPESRPSRSNLWSVLGTVSVACTMLTAWDPVFIPLGLLIAAICLRHRKAIGLSFVYLLTGVLTFCAVQLDYLIAYPRLFRDQIATIAYRAGGNFTDTKGSIGLHAIVDRTYFVGRESVIGCYSDAIRWAYQYFSEFSLLAVILLLGFWLSKRRRQNQAAIFFAGGLLFPGVLWYGFMRNYVAIHAFALVLFGPFAAIASGFILNQIWLFLEAHHYRELLWIMVIVFPALSLYPLTMYVDNARIPYQAQKFQAFSSLVASSTPENGIVLSPVDSLVPTYYTHRHIVRGIADEAWLRQATAQAHSAFPGSPLFFAIQVEQRPAFSSTLPHLRLIAQRQDSAIYALN